MNQQQVAAGMAAIDARRMQKFQSPNIEDLTGRYAKINIDERRENPVYRTVRFIAHAKYSLESQSSTTSSSWYFSNYANSRSSISVKTDFIENVVSIGVEPFYLPASMISAGELESKQLLLYFTSINHPENVIYDYRGSLDSVNAIPYHISCEIATNSTFSYKITPTVNKIMFSSPVSLRENWGVSFSSIARQLTIPPVILSATIFNNIPLSFTCVDHGLVNGEYVIVDSGTATNILNFPRPVTVVTTYQFTIGTSITLDIGQNVQVIPVSRMFRIPFTFTCMDSRPRSALSIGANLMI